MADSKDKNKPKAKELTFGWVCQRIRLARGLSQVDVAKRAGVHQARVSEIERDAYSPGLDQAQRIADGLGVNLSDMLAVREGHLDIDVFIADIEGIPIPGDLRFMAPKKTNPSKTEGSELEAFARKLGYEVLRALDEVRRTVTVPGTTPIGKTRLLPRVAGLRYVDIGPDGPIGKSKGKPRPKAKAEE